MEMKYDYAIVQEQGWHSKLQLVRMREDHGYFCEPFRIYVVALDCKSHSSSKETGDAV